jgi:H+/gluconate symporter-like permease
MVGIILILVALALLIYLAYRGVSLLILTPALSVLLVIATGGAPVLASYTQVFMGATGAFITSYFPIFLLGAVFGKLMKDSGCAEVLAQGIIQALGPSRAILAVVLSCALMTYGGVSLFVVAFAVYPIADALFRQANLPKQLIPASIALGAFTFTMSALPGTPAIQNAIPMPFFGTTPFAAPGLGILTGLFMFALGQGWLEYRSRRTQEGYVSDPDEGPQETNISVLREKSAGEGFDISDDTDEGHTDSLPSLWLSLLPLVLVIALNLVFTLFVIPDMDTAYLELPQFGETSIDAVGGLWSVVSALVVSIIVLLITQWSRLPKPANTLDNGAHASLLPIFNTASLVGFGAVIAMLPAFELIRDFVITLGGDNPLISLAIAVNLLSGMTGSASGGMSIALATLGDTYMAMAAQAGISPELLHRVTTVATGGLDALPHNGAVITLLSICGLSHRKAYPDIAMVAMLVPVLSLVFLITLGSIFGSF